MKVWVGVTDKSWFEQLAALAPDEVNFWQPSGSREFKVLQPGEPFLFKLHSPDNFIVGGGFFVRYSPLPISLAWDAFQQKNGVTSLEQLRARVHRYRRDAESLDPVIGCNVLAEPFFLKREDWIPIPASWPRTSFRESPTTPRPAKARSSGRACRPPPDSPTELPSRLIMKSAPATDAST